MAQETELKFELTPEAANALVQSGLLPGEPGVTPLRSTYFDTPARELWATGFSLRIRRAGDVRVQTIKQHGSDTAGLFVRSEWERPVDGDRPVLEDTPIGSLPGVNFYALGPAFRVHVERRTWVLASEDGEIELVLDRGEVAAGERRTPVCEIEIELKSGSVPALFALARRIDAVAPLRVGVLSKAERGYRLLGPAARAIKAEDLALPADLTAAAALRRIAASCVRQFRLNEPLIESSDGEALHQARVALRRLRSALAIHKAMLAGDDAFESLRETLRWLAGSLTEARDLDVLAARIGTAEVRMKLEPARIRAYGKAADALASARARTLFIDLSEWLAAGPWLTRPDNAALRDRPARAFAADVLETWCRKVTKRARGLADLDEVARHDVRKDAKKLRYAAEFFASLFDGKAQKRGRKRFLGALETLQDRLGELNDLATAPQVLDRLGLDGAPDAGEDSRALIAAAVKAHRALVNASGFWR